MSNDEQLAEKITSLVRTMIRLHSTDVQLKTSPFKRISGNFRPIKLVFLC